MSKLKVWMLWFISSLFFIFTSIINIIDKKIIIGLLFLFNAILYFILSITYYKKNK